MNCQYYGVFIVLLKNFVFLSESDWKLLCSPAYHMHNFFCLQTNFFNFKIITDSPAVVRNNTETPLHLSPTFPQRYRSPTPACPPGLTTHPKVGVETMGGESTAHMMRAVLCVASLPEHSHAARRSWREPRELRHQRWSPAANVTGSRSQESRPEAFQEGGERPPWPGQRPGAVFTFRLLLPCITVLGWARS